MKEKDWQRLMEKWKVLPGEDGEYGITWREAFAEADQSRLAAEEEVQSLASRIARLEKAQQIARSQENERSMVKAWDEIDLLKDRLAQAEAREAAMREALALVDVEWNYWKGHILLDHVSKKVRAALSPDAGRALKHVCGAQGLGTPSDVCPACDAEKAGRAARIPE